MLDIAKVERTTENGWLHLQGRRDCFRRTELPPPTEESKRQYAKQINGASVPVVGAFIPIQPVPQFPRDWTISPHVVGRPDFLITSVTVCRSPSNYLDVRFHLENNGDAAIALEDYESNRDYDFDPEIIPFAYLGDRRFKVFQVEQIYGRAEIELLIPGQSVEYRASVSNWAGGGSMRLYIPSGILGGAIRTFTLLVFQAPPPRARVIVPGTTTGIS